MQGVSRGLILRIYISIAGYPYFIEFQVCNLLTFLFEFVISDECDFVTFFLDPDHSIIIYRAFKLVDLEMLPLMRIHLFDKIYYFESAVTSWFGLAWFGLV